MIWASMVPLVFWTCAACQSYVIVSVVEGQYQNVRVAFVADEGMVMVW